ncbi:uncharacterized protein LOC110705886 [Chenopodium quinoa]|uniref:uncharacterized protein LOC110705886 n=1 Tax=Chenopodium quinoa TaxID=63459 RepID=UPI000B79A0DA|nr:uncharacterized protein LOC110705886 [Chenopodium quinoa]
MSGFVRRIWGKYGIDRISAMNNGVFLVRFKTMVGREKVMNSGPIMFDGRPVMMKRWEPGLDLGNEKVFEVPTWVRLLGLNLKFWGQSSLMKIAGLIRDPVKTDRCTATEEMLEYARITVKVKINGELLDEIEFQDECGVDVKQKVIYERKPIICNIYRGMGHGYSECPNHRIKNQNPPVRNQQQRQQKKPEVWKVWMPKAQQKTGGDKCDMGSLCRTTNGRVLFGDWDRGVGLNKLNKICDVLWFMKNQGIGLLGLLETKVKAGNFGKVFTGFCGKWSVTANYSKHHGGRIWIVWLPDVFQVKIDRVEAQLIHVNVVHKASKFVFWYTVVYGLNTTDEREVLWHQIGEIKNDTHGPWILGGDFNNVLNTEDKIGSPVTFAEIENFRQCVRQNLLIDFKAGGLFYTWNNKQQGSDRVCKKIDRILVNELWTENCREFRADFLPEGLMDHCPCIIRLFGCNWNFQKPFRIFNIWIDAPGYQEAVKQARNSDVKGTDMFIVVKMLQKVKEALKFLNLTNFSSVESANIIADAELENVQCQLNNDPRNLELIQMESDARERFLAVHTAKLKILKQKAKLHWMKEAAGPILDDVQHLSLCRGFTEEDVRSVVWSIEDDKAPGPDGFSSKFFKNAWGVVKNEVCKAVLGFFEHGQLLKQVNATTLTLVPKLDNATRVTQFRPITCCNVLYKIISKMLCERFKEDMLKEYNNKRKSPRCTIKVDLRKAYDSVHWSFIHDMLQTLNFPSRFISWVMECVTSPSFSIMINGGLNGFFKGKKGIRQGDPMSPLVFVIVMEYLSRLLKKVVAKRGFRFHRRCKSLTLNHLIFVDDLMLFSYADKKSISLLVRALKAFEGCSSLQANADKSAIYFGSVQPEVQQGIVTESGFIIGETPFKYLGIPLNAKYLRVSDFDAIVDKMLARITCWSSRKLSYTARVLLVNPVLITLHTYWVQCVLLPKLVILRITQLCKAFLWCGDVVLSKAPPIACDWVCMSKAEGGLGVRDCGMWNRAALGKYVWKIAKKEDSLWVKWVRVVYIKGQDWWTYSPKRSAGWAWRRLCAVKDQLKEGFEQNNWLSGTYRISQCYKWLQGAGTKVDWCKWVLNKFNIPKHSFILWLAMHDRHRTREKLWKYNACAEDSCLLCGAEIEDRQHMFFNCKYSQECVPRISHWLHIRIQNFYIDEVWKNWLKEVKDKVQHKVVLAVLAVVVYHIWFARNTAFWEKVVIHPSKLSNAIGRPFSVVVCVLPRRQQTASI